MPGEQYIFLSDCQSRKICARHSCQGREGSMLRMDYVFSTLDIIGHFTVVYLDAKPLIWSDAEGDLVVTETST